MDPDLLPASGLGLAVTERSDPLREELGFGLAAVEPGLDPPAADPALEAVRAGLAAPDLAEGVLSLLADLPRSELVEPLLLPARLPAGEGDFTAAAADGGLDELLLAAEAGRDPEEKGVFRGQQKCHKKKQVCIVLFFVKVQAKCRVVLEQLTVVFLNSVSVSERVFYL